MLVIWVDFFAIRDSCGIYRIRNEVDKLIRAVKIYERRIVDPAKNNFDFRYYNAKLLLWSVKTKICKKKFGTSEENF